MNNELQSVTSLLDFNKVPSLSSTFICDQHLDSTARVWTFNGTRSLNVDEYGKSIHLNTNQSKLYMSSGMYITSVGSNDFAFNVIFKPTQVKQENDIISFTTSTTEHMVTYFTPSAIGIRYKTTSNIEVPYIFEVGVKCLLTIVKKGSVFKFYVNGDVVGVVDSGTLNQALSSVPSNSSVVIGAAAMDSHNTASGFIGYVYLFNMSYGYGITQISEDPFSLLSQEASVIVSNGISVVDKTNVVDESTIVIDVPLSDIVEDTQIVSVGDNVVEVHVEVTGKEFTNYLLSDVNPVSKIDLDFTNSYADKYNNSTWSPNNGYVINTVEGALYLPGNVSGLGSGINNNLNFANKDFKVSLDLKPLELGRANQSGILTTPQVGSYVPFYLSQLVGSVGLSVGTTIDNQLGWGMTLYNAGIAVLPSSYINSEIVRKGNVFALSVNGVLSDIKNINNTQTLFNLNAGGDTIIGTSRNDIDNTKFNGYIDNVRVAKDDPLSGIDIYKTNNNCTVAVEDSKAVVKSVSMAGIAFKYSTPNSTSFKLRSKMIKGSGDMSIILGVTGWSLMSMTAYVVTVSNSTISLSKGLNPLSAPQLTLIKSHQITPVDSNFDVIVEVINGTSVNIYNGSELIISANGLDTINSNRVGYGCFNGASFMLDEYSIDVDNKNVHRNVFNTQIEFEVNTPILDIPLKRNCTNVGLSGVVVDVGTPVYNGSGVTLSKGNYIKIASELNQYNVGLTTDFYISYDYTPIEDVYHYLMCNNSSTNQSLTAICFSNSNDVLASRVLIRCNGDVVGYSTNQTTINQKHNVELRRRNGVLSITLDGVDTIIPNANLDFSLSGLNFGGTSIDSDSPYASGQLSNVVMFIGRSDRPTTYNNKHVIATDFTKSNNNPILIEDECKKHVIYPVGINTIGDSGTVSLDGSTQYIHLPRSRMFDFGTDDFVIHMKVNIKAKSNWCVLLSSSTDNSATSDYMVLWVNASGQIFISNPQKAVITSSNNIIIGDNEIFVTRDGDQLSVELNGIVTSDSIVDIPINFNLSNNIRVGSSARSGWDGIHNLYGSINEFQVLRYTSKKTDLLQLGTVVTKTVKLNSEDAISVHSNIDSVFNITVGDDLVNLNVLQHGNETNVTSEFNNLGSNIITFNNDVVKHYTIYNSIIDLDNFVNGYNQPLFKTKLPFIQHKESIKLRYEPTLTNTQFKGFIEGAVDVKYTITDQFGVFVSSGIDDYNISNINTTYDKYTITLDNGIAYQVTKHIMERGFISGTVDISKCNGTVSKLKPSDMTVWCYVNGDQRLIGSYPVANDGTYNIPNLDVHTRYDLIFKHNMRIVENISSSYRKPKRIEDIKIPRVVNLDYTYSTNSTFVEYTWRYINGVTFSSVKLYITNNPIIDSSTPFIELGNNVTSYKDRNIVHDHQYYVTIVATYEGNDYRSTQKLVNTHDRIQTVITSVGFNKTTGNVLITW